MTTPAILQTHNLSMRFGGVTAVDGVDLAVEPKCIFSVIGPNGAGKTTLFNCITGLETPTAGWVRFAGQDLRRRSGWRAAAVCLASGIVCGLLSAALALDLNGLWHAAIRRPASLLNAPFTWRESWRQTRGYLRGDLAVERLRQGRWQVVTADGRTPLAIAATPFEAESLREQLEAISRRTGQARVAGGRGRWAIDTGLNRGSGQILRATAPFPSRAAAQEKLDLLIEIAARRSQRRRWIELAASLGAIVGVAGAWAAWRRSRWTPDRVARAGVARTFQNLRLFKHMTALENVLVALEQSCRSSPQSRLSLRESSATFAERKKTSPRGASAPTNPKRKRGREPDLPRSRFGFVWGALFGGSGGGCATRARGPSDALAFLRRVGLAEAAARPAGQLSYGDQRRLEIARALALRPRLLLLDEPAAGMNPTETASLIDLVRGIRDEGITVILIEHQMELVMGISDRIAVLDGGRKIAEGTPAEVRRDPEVLRAYLGVEEGSGFRVQGSAFS